MKSKKVEVVIVPETWIIAPRIPEGYAERWGLDPHLDRAFPRSNEGKIVFYKIWLEAPMTRAAREMGMDPQIARNWEILDEYGNTINFATVQGSPMKYSRYISKSTDGKSTLENFEFLDATNEIKMTVRVYDVALFTKLLALAGRVGVLSRTNKGYGRFIVKVNSSPSERDNPHGGQ